jgi:SAM-dependent methyltransferase
MSQEAGHLELRAIRDQISVLNIAEGFFQSRVVFALLRLRVFELISDGDKALDELAAELGARPGTLARLLNAGVVLKLLETRDGFHYRLTPLSRSVLLPSAREGYLGDWIRNLAYFDLALAKLDEAVLKSAPTIGPLRHLGADRDQTREFTLAMHAYASLRGKELAFHLDTTGCKTLLDLGCGPGTYAFHLGISNPELELYLLDLPAVLQVAKEVQGSYPLKNEVHYVPADALRDEISGQYDIVLVSNTLHVLGPEASRALIKRLHKSVKPGGSLIIQAQFLRDDRLGERWPVLLDLVQLCTTSAGRNHSVQETGGWMEEAEFSDIEFHRMSFFNTNSFLRGYKRQKAPACGV